MKWNKKILASLLVLAASNAQAAVKDHDVQYRLAIQEDGQMRYEPRRQNYGFRMEIVDDSEGVKPESFKNGRPFVAASRGERYSVRLYNPLPVRVGVNLTVDGLNSITGKPSGITDGSKWMIEPYGSVTIPGWQVSGGEARRFFFTNKPKSYAKWLGDETGMNLSANCGVIGAAFFWSQKELDQYYDFHPIYRTTQNPVPYSGYRSNTCDSLSMSGAQAAAPEAMGRAMKKSQSEDRAGTGMGERESHPTYEVAFDFDRGMYSPSQALVIYYDFEKTPSPNPFPALGYAPEQP